MDRKHFRGILKKYLQGHATPEEVEMIDAWYAEMGKETEAMLKDASESTVERKYWSSIHPHIRKNRVRTLINWQSISIAASLIVVGLAAWYYVAPEATQSNTLVEALAPPQWQQVFNTGKTARLVTLSDGSSVTLEPQSNLRFPSVFKNNERSVFLEGEGFFDVTRDEGRPFVVRAGLLKTKVLGTSFRISAYAQDKDVTVAVTTGKVSVSRAGPTETDSSRTGEIILTPNQQIVFNKEEKRLLRMIVENPQPILPVEEVRAMRFDAAPVTEIFEAIEKVYGVDLVFDSQTFSSCTLTSVITDGELYNRLDIICKAIGATYSIRANQIVIDGAGCDYQ